MEIKMEINEALATKVLEAVSHGLVKGLGVQEPGKMCVEAAVCYAMGLPHGDEPTCVGSAVRSYKIRINDSQWTSDKARADGMRRVAIAQLGSESIDQLVFAKRVAVLNIQKVLAKAFRYAEMEVEAKECEAFNNFYGIKEFAKKIKAKTDIANAIAIANAIVNANVNANTYAIDIAYDIANAIVNAIINAIANANVNANVNANAKDIANAIAIANAYANAYAYAVAIANANEFLTLACESAVQALQEQNCEGCKYLYLTELKNENQS
jgi:hypothetical protein